MKHALKSLSFVLLLTAILLSVSATRSFADNDDYCAEVADGALILKDIEL